MPIPKPHKGEQKSKFISRCMSAIGGEYEDNDQAMAICETTWKDRNKPAGNEFHSFRVHLDTSQVREETYKGRVYLVAPVVMIKAPIVMNGMLYTVEEVSKFPSTWNNRPVTLFHPKNEAGDYISANDSAVSEDVHLGMLRNTQFDDDGRLVSESWVDKLHVESYRPEILDYYYGRRQNLEVSTGLFSDILKVSGKFGDDPYDSISLNIRSDHLALLPGGEGACGWSHGCGLRANEGEDVDEVIEFRKQQYLQANASTLKGIMEAMRKAVDGMDDRTWVHYFRDAKVGRNAHVIYTKEKRWVEGQFPESAKTYRQTYEIDGNGVVALTGTPEEVVIQTTYVTVSEKQEEQTMNKEQKVNALIACQRCRYAEKDREFLMGLNEKQLDLIAPPENVVVLAANDLKPEESILVQDGNIIVNAPKPKKGEAKADYMGRCKGVSGMDDGKCKMAWDRGQEAPTASEKEEKLETNEKPQTAMAWLNSQENMPEAVKETLRESMLTNESIKIELITNLVKHPRNKFTQDQLIAKSVSELKTLAELAGPPIPNEKLDEAAPSFFGLQASTFQAKRDEQKAPEPMVAPSLVACLKEDRLKK